MVPLLTHVMLVVKGDPAAFRLVVAGDTIQERALPCATGAQDADEGIRRDRKRCVLNQKPSALTDSQARRCDARAAGRSIESQAVILDAVCCDRPELDAIARLNGNCPNARRR